MKNTERQIIPYLILFLIAAALSLPGALHAQSIAAMEFRNQPITDILMVLAEVSGTSIVPDETVSGNATYYFSDTKFEEAFSVFLSSYKLYSWRKDGVIHVSRIRAEYDDERDLVSLDGEDVPLELLVRSLSRVMGRTILYDPLPRSQTSVHLQKVPPEKSLAVLMTQYPEYEVRSDADFFYIKRLPPEAQRSAQSEDAKREVLLLREDGKYDIDIDRARFLQVLDDLFRKAEKEYSLFLRSDLMLENLRFSGKSFEEALRLILEQAGGDWAVSDGVYYIFEIQKRDILKKLKTTVQIPLSHLPVQDLPNLFPQELAGQNFFRLDKASNSVILSGSVEEIGPVEEFIRMMDRPLSGKLYHRFDLSHQKVKDVIPLLPSRFASLSPQVIPGSNAFVMLLSQEMRDELASFLRIVDQGVESAPVKLKYLKSEMLLKNLPPSVEKEDVIQTGDSRLLFFRGPAEKRERFFRELALLDRPVPQIRYDLLVVQYQESKGSSWSNQISNSLIEEGAENAFLGTIGNILSLNFDIVSTFGYQFASRLSLELSENSARVLADTTLNGLSGEDIKFQNTNTYRYRDLEVDPDTGEASFTGVTREITSGLIITMNGWASGDDMITMNVGATVSKRGADVSSNNGNPPPTSEKVVQTHVRTPSGKPVVIGGLIQQDVDAAVKKIPVLGDIPLLGLLFRSTSESVENTEFVIYIVPHLERSEDREMDVDEKLSSLYRKFVASGEEAGDE